MAMQRATRFLQHLTMSLRALTSTQPRPQQAAEVLGSAQMAISQLSSLADSPHRQNLLWCLGTHAIVFELLKVIVAVEKAEGPVHGLRMPAESVRTAAG